MDKEKRSLFQRIRNARQSLENAEKSFQDDRGIRGELDLMLAEAELKNLRNKQAVPWSWNRNIFALCIAMLLCIAGLCGWYFAKGAVSQEEAAVVPAQQQVEQKPAVKEAPVTNKQAAGQTDSYQQQETSPEEKTEEAAQIYVSKKDLRDLVRTAKSELANGK